MSNEVSTVNQRDQRTGDLIEIFHGSYKHWAVYVGDGFVVHVTTPDGGRVMGSGSGRNNKKAVIKIERLKDAVQGMEWKINNLLDKNNPSRKADDIVKLARSLVGTEPHHHLLENNCEHFATILRYGKCESQQVRESFEILEEACRNTAVVGLGVGLGRSLLLWFQTIFGGRLSWQRAWPQWWAWVTWLWPKRRTRSD